MLEDDGTAVAAEDSFTHAAASPIGHRRRITWRRPSTGTLGASGETSIDRSGHSRLRKTTRYSFAIAYVVDGAYCPFTGTGRIRPLASEGIPGHMGPAHDSRHRGDLLTIGDAATVAAVHRNTVRSWCTAGQLPSVRVNARGEHRIRRADLVAFLASKRARETPQASDLSAARPATPVHAKPVAAESATAAASLAISTALRRLTAELTGSHDLATVFEEVLGESVAVFRADRAGIWLNDSSDHPLKLAAQRGMSIEMVDWLAGVQHDADAAGLRAIRTGQVIVVDDAPAESRELREMYARAGVRTICYVPIVFKGDPLGVLILYHREPYPWSPEERDLAGSFADGMAAAIANARLFESNRALGARLDAIRELGLRLNGIRDVEGIGEAIVTEAGQLIEHDTIRVYRVDEATGFCEPIAFQGHLLGTDNPDPARLRVPLGSGLTGWAAVHGESILLADSRKDPRRLLIGVDEGPESMLVVPTIHENRVLGVIVLSKLGEGCYGPDDERTLWIFAGYAAHALANAEHLELLGRQREELEHQLASQRRLLDVNERLLSTLDQQGVLEMIADSLLSVVYYNSLVINRVDRERGILRSVVARDAYAQEILDYESRLDEGLTGWVITHAEAVMANEAHLDPRTVFVPGTPVEPEAMIIVPLIVSGVVQGTLNIGRVGEHEPPFTANEFELTKLFAGQASLALRNAEVHGEARVRAERDALTGLLNHGAFQRELGAALHGRDESPLALLMMDLDGFKGFNDTFGHPAGDGLLERVAVALGGAVRAGDRIYRYGGDEFAVILDGADVATAREIGERIAAAVAAFPTRSRGPQVTISVGVACYPADGRSKTDLVAAADRALYLAKPTTALPDDEAGSRDPYLAALDETAVALLERREPTELLETILARATGLLGTPHGYIYLVDDADDDLVVRVGAGRFRDVVGYRLGFGKGVAGRVYSTGRPVVVEDYDSFVGRAPDLPTGFGSVVGVPLTSGPRVVGVIGVASGGVARTFGQREIGALSRFGQLASIALDNARLFESAQRSTLYDLVTGLPNRESLSELLSRRLRDAGAGERVGVVLLDLDGFRTVNETLGHATGDQLLVAVGQRLTGSVRPGDTVARFAGDTFGIVLASVSGPGEARRAADRVRANLEAPFDIDGREWFVAAQMGIAVGRPGESVATELLHEAEIALVRAKADPAIDLAIFEPAMSGTALARVDLENDLRRALERDELRVHYQPLVDLATNRVVGIEALVRWEHPQRGLVSPAAFIPMAEQSGLIVPLGDWVLETACVQARAWREEHPDAGLVVSVNLSGRQFAQPDLLGAVLGILRRTGLPPNALELEITESVAMEESEATLRTLRALREVGVRLVLDDFGTGYSSLAYLKQLPLDSIKLDRTFIADLGVHDANIPIVSAVVALAHGLGIDVVAEGIETLEQRALLESLGCDRGQGFLYAPPLPPEAAGLFLTQEHAAA